MYLTDGMGHIKNNLSLGVIALILLAGCSRSSPNATTGELSCCARNYRESLGQVGSTMKILKGTGKYTYRKHTFIIEEDSLSLNGFDMLKIDSIKNSFSQLDLDSLKVYCLDYNDRVYFMLGSDISAATGLAVNFRKWILIDAESTRAISTGLMSLSDCNPLLYLNENTLFLTVCKFSDEFIHGDQNWDNPKVNIVTYKIENEALTREKQIDTFCPCEQ
jgi:hypothetical protein